MESGMLAWSCSLVSQLIKLILVVFRPDSDERYQEAYCTYQYV